MKMKISLSLLATLLSFAYTDATEVHQQNDIYYHRKPVLGASMWHFSPDGLTIFSPTGVVLKEHLKKTLCKPYQGYGGVINEDCYYYTYASDGQKYVFAGSMASPHHVQVFDLDTGDFAGRIETCSTPVDLEYLPTRQEMWLRCASDREGHDGHIDVFSANSLSSDFDLVALNTTAARSYGRLAVHSSMQGSGYVSTYNLNYIAEMDLSSKTILDTYEIPKAQGAYDMTYSPVNHHIFARARVCCSCDDLGGTCSRTSQVLVQTGPSTSLNLQDGTCGAGCEGSLADTIGVVEFDTVSKQIVAEHNIKSGTGLGADPVASPDGKYVLLLPNDGGKYVRILSPGKNGEKSTLSHDVNVNFSGGTAGTTVVSDFAFIQDSSRNILILGAKTDNEIVLVDLDDGFRHRKLNLAPGVAESTGGGGRSIEWAVGTDYVWINGGESKEVYILKMPSGINSAFLHNTIADVTAGEMIFVNNYERLRTIEMMEATARAALSDTDTGTGNRDPPSNTNSGTRQISNNDSSGNDYLGVAGVVIGSIALTVCAALGLYVLRSSGNRSGSSTGTQSQEGAFQDDPESAKTLGSKQMN